jgi:hypothetical protein
VDTATFTLGQSVNVKSAAILAPRKRPDLPPVGVVMARRTLKSGVEYLIGFEQGGKLWKRPEDLEEVKD